MDGNFVPNLTLSPWFIEQTKQITNTPISTHLMVNNPSFWVDQLIKVHSEYICFPAERVNGIAFRIINKIHNAGLKAGVVLNPETLISSIKPYLSLLDKVTILTVDPGFAGEIFIESALNKIKNLNQIKKENNYHYLTEIDGSVNKKTFSKVYKAHPDIYIIGNSGLFSLNDNIEISWEKMRNNFLDETKQVVI